MLAADSQKQTEPLRRIFGHLDPHSLQRLVAVVALAVLVDVVCCIEAGPQLAAIHKATPIAVAYYYCWLVSFEHCVIREGQA